MMKRSYSLTFRRNSSGSTTNGQGRGIWNKERDHKMGPYLLLLVNLELKALL